MAFTVAILGRPNVGKSTLFNRLTSTRDAIVNDTPGVTRDRREGRVTFGDLHFTLIDTAGLEEAETDTLEAEMMQQTVSALTQADMVLLIVDGRTGLTPDDTYFARWVRRSDRPVILIANKCESYKSDAGRHEAYSLGFGTPIAVSAEHGVGMGDLYDTITEKAQELNLNIAPWEENALESDLLQIAIIGRPNVGKSTLVNQLLGEERVIASPIAGTTRDAIYLDWEYRGTPVRLVDTAGLRKRAKRTETLEKLSVDDTYEAIRYANLAVLVTDATQALDKQDLLLADHVINEGRGLVIAVNKWDLVTEKKETLEEIKYKLEHTLAQARGVPLVVLSALEGKFINRVMKASMDVFSQWNTRISTGKLNRWLEEATERHPPPLAGGRRIRFRYITQVKARPPTFLLFTSSKIKELPESYLRYLTNSLRDHFGLDGVPIRIRLRKQDNPYGN